LLQLELPNELNRASDYLNLADDFFTLETSEGLLLVNKFRVREVRVFVASPMPAEQE
jgi:hypothetical protein